ncbi:MAG: AI-2E family transporter [Algoriphagus sp.]|uniref:AI-2E family transporter n=4 Tax=Algoriphagus sp. TaxID=1872435 RepID=UPI00329A4228
MTNTDKNTQGKEILIFFTLLVVGLYFFITGIMSATGFLIPITISVLLALICIPLARKLENWGLGRGLSSFVCVLLSFVAFLSFFALISFQISQFSDKWPEIEEKTKSGLESIESYVSEATGFSFKEDIDQLFPGESERKNETATDAKEQSLSTSENREKPVDKPSTSSTESLLSKIPSGVLSNVGGVVMGFFGFLTNSLLAMIYLFFFLYYRTKLKLSILNFFKKENLEDAKKVFGYTIQLALDFLVGRMILIAFLTVIYGIGLSISGIDNAILISILAAVLSLIPYIGNVIGVVLAMSMAAISGGELSMFIGVAVTYFLAQFIESYILQPYVVGGKVNINPIVTILVVVLGGTIWGVAGMILSIPLVGIFKIICDAVPALQPIGYLLGEDDLKSEDEEPGKLKQWGEKIWSKISSN